MADQSMPQDPAAEFLVGGAPQPTQKIMFMGQEFDSLQQAEASLAALIRQREMEYAELRGAQQAQQQPQQPVPQTPQQKWDNDAYFKALAADPVSAQERMDRYRLFGDPDAKFSV